MPQGFKKGCKSLKSAFTAAGFCLVLPLMIFAAQQEQGEAAAEGVIEVRSENSDSDFGKSAEAKSSAAKTPAAKSFPKLDAAPQGKDAALRIEESQKVLEDLQKAAKGGNDEFSGRMRHMLKKYDKDGDGKLNEEERAAAKEDLKKQVENYKKLEAEVVSKIIRRFDQDGDGKLNETELKLMLAAQRRDIDNARFREMKASFDKQFPSKPHFDYFKVLNINIEKLDFEQRRKVHETYVAILETLGKKYDKNGDGKLERPELNEMLKDPFAQKAMADLRDSID